MLANLISHNLIRPMGKIKIETFRVFDIHWLYRTPRYAIVKVDVTQLYDVTKCHGIIVTIWRTSAIEVTALSKIHFQKWQICKKKNLPWVWRTDRKIRPSGSQSYIIYFFIIIITFFFLFFLNQKWLDKFGMFLKAINWIKLCFIVNGTIIFTS